MLDWESTLTRTWTTFLVPKAVPPAPPMPLQPPVRVARLALPTWRAIIRAQLIVLEQIGEGTRTTLVRVVTRTVVVVMGEIVISVSVVQTQRRFWQVTRVQGFVRAVLQISLKPPFRPVRAVTRTVRVVQEELLQIASPVVQEK